jgi:hypothetical protein
MKSKDMIAVIEQMPNLCFQWRFGTNQNRFAVVWSCAGVN